MAHILVVEDDKMNSLVFERVLTRMGGHRTTITEDADEVLFLVRGGDVELVAMDVSLSDTTLDGKPVAGLDLTREIKRDPAIRHIPVNLATAHAMRGDRENFLSESGADDYLAKPVADHKAFCELVAGTL